MPTVLCCTLLLSPTATAQAQSSSPALDAVLARIEFNGTETPERLGPDLVKLTENDLALLCGMLVEPGTGDDTKARMALHALTLYLADRGTPDRRGGYVDALCTALESDQPTAVKEFLIGQLQLAGDARASNLLFRCLGEDELRDRAVQALLAIGGDDAADGLVEAAVDGEDKIRISVVTAVLQIDDFDLLQRLARKLTRLKLNHENTGGLPRTDVALLSTVNTLPGAAHVLGARAHSTSEREEREALRGLTRAEFATWAMDIADSLALSGDAELAVRTYRDLYKLFDSSEEIHVRSAALHGLASLAPLDAVDDVVSALTDENPELRAAAMEIATKLGGEGVTAAYAGELAKASPEACVAILNVLARRKDMAGLPSILPALDHESKDVRIAAIKATAAIGGERFAVPLVTCLGRDDDDERDAAADELVKLAGKGVSSDLADALGDAPPRMKCALLSVLARRRATDELDTIKKYMRHEDQAVCIAAINAVGDLAEDVGTVQRLLLLLEGVEAQEEREAIETAMVDVCKRPDDNADHIGTVIDGIEEENVPEYCSLLRVLGHLGGQAASEILLAAARDSRAEVTEATLRGFSSFPDPDRDMTASVLELATEATETKPHVLGMRAFASLLKRTEENVANKLFLYQAGLGSARRVEEKRLLLSGMADVKDTRTLAVLAPYLEDEELRSETGSAMIMAARGTLPKGWPEAHRALELVLASVTEDRVRRHAQDVMKEVEQFEGFVTDWRVAGPYFVEGKAGHDILDTPFPPEEPGAQNVEWKEQTINESWGDFWHIDLASSIGGDHRGAYLRTYVWSEHEQPVLLELGSDDGIKVWLNGEVIHTNNALRGCGQGQDKVKATLGQGWNELMLKVTNDGGGWGACARLRAAEGGTVKGIKVDANGPPDSSPRHD